VRTGRFADVNDDEAADEFDAITRGQQMSRAARFQTGELAVEDLDDEELRRGQFRNRNGNFSGGRSDVIPRAMLNEWHRRVRQGAVDVLAKDTIAMVEALTSIATNPEVATADRLNAIKYGLDRVLGKAVERVDVQVSEKPWETLLKPGGIFRRIPDEDPVKVPLEIEAPEVEK
jgi:hypothetical protein